MEMTSLWNISVTSHCENLKYCMLYHLFDNHNVSFISNEDGVHATYIGKVLKLA
jgi:hypothetical protein